MLLHALVALSRHLLSQRGPQTCVLHKHHKMYFMNIGLLVVFSEKLHVFLMKAMPCCGPLIIGAILLHGTTTNIYLIVAFTVMKRQTKTMADIFQLDEQLFERHGRIINR